MGITLTYLSLVVLIPLGSLFVKAAQSNVSRAAASSRSSDARVPTSGWSQFWDTVTEPVALASYKLSFGASLAAATMNAVFGFTVAWVLVRYRFPGKKLFDAMVDLPFALPTAVSGIALTAVYADTGWIGRWLPPGIEAVHSRLGVVIALTFVGLPFVVRTLQPAMEDLDPEIEEAAASLGANRLQTFCRVLVPALLPALLTGFALAFARGLGEYGSVVFMSSNLPMQTQITPLVIMGKLEQFDYAGATAIAVVMLIASFALLLLINMLQWWSRRYE
ncbi:MAG: sulfate ABC transporter permease subunit CysT [Planctomycetota bacterium]